MKNQTILNNLYAANIFLPLLVTFLRQFENKWYLPVGSSRRRMIHEISLFLHNQNCIAFQKYIILKVDNILNRYSNHTSFAPFFAYALTAREAQHWETAVTWW